MFQTGLFTRSRAPTNGIDARLPPNVALLGLVSLLTAMSSAMVYGLLPLFLVKVLGTNAAVVGIIEGTAEATTSLLKLTSGAISDWVGRRKPLLVLGYTLSAFNKLLFPAAEAVSTIYSGAGGRSHRERHPGCAARRLPD
jgi:MFS family permease